MPIVRRKDKALATLQTILDAAEQVFFEKGVSGATLEGIAQRAKVTRGAIYWHFANREDILFAVMDRTYRIFEESILQLSLSNEPHTVEALRNYSVGMLKDIAADRQKQRAIAIIMFKHEHSLEKNAIWKRRQQAYKRMLKSLSAYLEKMWGLTNSSDRTKRIQIMLIAQAFLFFNHGVILNFLQFPATVNLKKDAERYVDILFHSPFQLHQPAKKSQR